MNSSPLEDIIQKHSSNFLNSIKDIFFNDDPEYESSEINMSQYYNTDEIINVIQNNPTAFTVLSLNCQSLPSKLDQLKLYLATLKQNSLLFSAICLQETWLSDASDLSLLQLDDYTLLNRNSSISSHGGIAIYLRKDYSFSHIDLNHSSTVWDGQFIKITDTNTNKKLVLGNLYRPPRDNNANYTIFMEELALILDSINNITDEAVIAGDFNIDLLKINEKPIFDEYYNMVVGSGFHPQITLPTRLTENNATLIDNFLCKLSLNCSRTSRTGILLNNISDHQPYFISFDFIQPQIKVPKYYEQKQISPNFESHLREELRGFEMKFNRNEAANPNENYNLLVNKIHTEIQKCTKIKKVKYN